VRRAGTGVDLGAETPPGGAVQLDAAAQLRRRFRVARQHRNELSVDAPFADPDVHERRDFRDVLA